MASMNLNRVYIPQSARTNQYILAEFRPCDAFYRCFSDVESCYTRLARQLFELCDVHGLHNVQLVANDKLPVVRYHDESYTLETQKQILFFYNPKYHEARKVHYKAGYQATKIRFVFLATGDELRANAAQFHAKVSQVLGQFRAYLKDDNISFKLRDHQHLTYDIFAKAKGNKESYGYKLRSLYPRYQARNTELPSTHSEITYVSFNVPLTRAIKNAFSDKLTHDNYEAFYRHIEDSFLSACESKQLNHIAMVANGKTPIIRNRQIDKSESNRELEKISFDTHNLTPQLRFIWDETLLPDTLKFVLVASQKDKKDVGYGRFMNQVEAAIKQFLQTLPIEPDKQDINVRFFQHISYTL